MTQAAAAEVLTSIVRVSRSALSLVMEIAGQRATAELLVRSDHLSNCRYAIRIQNPTRRSLYLDHVRVISPDSGRVMIRPKGIRRRGTIRRLMDEAEVSPSLPRPKKAVYLLVPPGTIEDLELQVMQGPNDSEQWPQFDIKLQLVWSPAVPLFSRLLAQRTINANASQLKSMTLAASAKKGPGPGAAPHSHCIHCSQAA